MWLNALTLANFRNISRAQLAFSAGCNIILGPNGQGKTNLLEAIYLLSYGRSCRASSDKELVNQAQSQYGCLIKGIVHPGQIHPEWRQPYTLEIRLEPSGVSQRLSAKLKKDETVLKRRAQWLGQLPSVAFFAQDLALLRGSPGERRHWLDAATSQWHPQHAQYLAEFERVLAQKNRALKTLQIEAETAPILANNTELISVLNTQFAQTAARLLASRQAYLATILPEVTETHAQLTGQDRDGTLNLLYWAKGSLGSDVPPGECCETLADWEAALTERLKLRLLAERVRGSCLIGPQRDDLSFFITPPGATAPLEATTFASQGQQRSIVLALKLAERACLSKALNLSPIILLDDVMAELDPDRQHFLLCALQSSTETHNVLPQVFLSTTHLTQAEQFIQATHAGVHPTQIYQVHGGQFTAASADAPTMMLTP
ncbi:MAG: DNA replication and repair protein RecF [Vampirovibrionales bacterium]|nr:DNA replication and repair protein RecF [Vampirovibrionales bacterium]